jgi:hypothetical protein
LAAGFTATKEETGMTSHTARLMIRRRSVVGMLVAGALLAAAAGLAADEAAAIGSAQLDGADLRVMGDTGTDHIALRLQAGVPDNLQVDLDDDGTAEATFDRGSFDGIVVFARGGDDRVRIDEANGVFVDRDTPTSLLGGGGDDTLIGGSRSVALGGGSGDDTFVSTFRRGTRGLLDAAGIDGGSGNDTVDVIGAVGAETFGVAGFNGTLTVFDPTPALPGNVAVAALNVETLDIHALGGADAVTIGDLSTCSFEAGCPSSVDRVNVNLAAALDSSAGDGEADSVVVNATAGRDDIDIRPNGGRAVVSGLAARIAIASPEAADDRLTVNTLGGEDQVRLGTGLSDLIRTRVNA